MSKKIIFFLTLTLTIIFSSCLKQRGTIAYNDENDFEINIVNDGKSAVITDYVGTKTTINIPPKIKGKTVIGIDQYAFIDNDNTFSITIPYSVTDGVPLYNGNLIEINVDSKNKVYSSDNGILYNKDKTCLYAYPAMKTDISFAVPNSVIGIEGSAFAACVNLEKIIIGNSVISIGDYVFNYCVKLESITIPDSVINIGNSAFFKCSGLTAINVDDNNKAYSSDNGILYNKNKTGLHKYPPGKTGSSFTIPNGVTNIGDYAFNDCVNLERVTISDSVTVIGKYAFAICENIETIIIPNSVTNIGNNSFQGCEKLKSVTIPNSVTNIGASAFSFCKNLKSVTIPNGITVIRSYAFSNSGFESIIIPESVTKIESWAFSGCKKLKSITIPDGVITIENSAFSYCFSLERVTIPDGVTAIGRSAFHLCDSLVTVVIKCIINQDNFDEYSFPGNLREKYFANGIGTYTTKNPGREAIWVYEGNIEK